MSSRTGLPGTTHYPRPRPRPRPSPKASGAVTFRLMDGQPLEIGVPPKDLRFSPRRSRQAVSDSDAVADAS
jgi:hypothetical protein